MLTEEAISIWEE